ncbi:MAG TPA: chemotaxis protein CheW [Phycisphaerales bacterium]|nr:chemotaxis protein CheW [Phycisphaerales bacterium]HCD32678.1 chemotaxis protein CheW [Phycisphaerales bacterium]
MSEQELALNQTNIRELVGKYLTFHLSQEQYGVSLLAVREIIGLMDITHVPRTPEYVRGVINLRGRIIPVVDLRLKFGMQAIDDTEVTCIIVVEMTYEDQVIQIGILVDEVDEVLDIQEGQIDNLPSIGADMSMNYICGVAKISQRVVMLLDIQRVLSAMDLNQLVKTTGIQKENNTSAAA